MKKLIFFILFFTGYILPQDTLNLDLKKSIELALEYNHDLKLAEFDRDKAEEKIREAYGSSVFPKINGTVDYNRAIKRGVFIFDAPPPFGGTFPQGTENTLSLGATLEQPLFTGSIFLAVRIAKTYADISGKMVDAARSELIVNVKQAYYSVLLAKEEVKLSKLNLELAEDNLNNTKAMYHAGVVPEYDYIRAKVEVQNLIPELQQAENSLTLSFNMLKLVTGLQLDKQIIINDSLLFREMQTDTVAQNDVLERNYTLKQLQLQIKLQDDNVSYEFSKHFPELYLEGTWSDQAQENDPRSFSRWRYNNSIYVGLNLRVPIFDGFQTTSRVEQAKIDLSKAEEDYSKNQELTKNQFQETILNIKQTREKIDSYKAGIDEAQLGYEIANKRYKSGIGTQLENVDALVTLSRAKVNYYTAVYDYYLYHARLDQLLARENF
ncbi:MAG TPA: TolC family protein [Ignavibacteriaceae bacterium]|nr:TolC family protein [Ignavibacteriaceae bacterium]